MSFASPWGTEYSATSRRGMQKQLSLSNPILFATTASAAVGSASSSITTSLPNLYPSFSDILISNGYLTPTPIQQSSAPLAKEGENLLLIAATGSGKTLAYLLPLLSHARTNSDRTQRKTVLIVAPTRELAAQLARDASLLLPDAGPGSGDTLASPSVLLAVRGIPPPTPVQLSAATVLVGTPSELHAVLTRISGARDFLAGDTLSGLILDEADVLLPPASKTLRTAFDGGGHDCKQERKVLEQRRKLRAAQRRGVEFQGGSSVRGKSITAMDLSDAKNSQVLSPTERVLRLIASAQYLSEDDDRLTLQILAGSATASRATLDRLNKALRWAAMEGGVIGGMALGGVWRGRMKVCRPEDKEVKENQTSEEVSNNEPIHTIRAVTVPSAVDHKYVAMTKDAMTKSHEILANVAKVARKLQPKTSLVFICGEFSRSISNEKKTEAPKITGSTSKARRNAKRKRVFIEKQKSKAFGRSKTSGPEPLSVRQACSALQSMGVDAQPMHVVLGLEPNAPEGVVIVEESGNGEEVEIPPVLVTFEGSARGLHFDEVDIVFVVGRPSSSASYLHLAGRVGRSMSSPDDPAFQGKTGEVEVRPGTIVSFCSKGRVAELEKWTSQVGATGLQEIVLC